MPLESFTRHSLSFFSGVTDGLSLKDGATTETEEKEQPEGVGVEGAHRRSGLVFTIIISLQWN